MNLTTDEQLVYDSGFARGLALGTFDPPAGLPYDDQIVWRCGLYAGLAEGLRRKLAYWQAELDAVHLVPPSEPPAERGGPPPVTDADRDEVDAGAVVWGRLPPDDDPLEPRDD
jgi:hypothetical protein